MYTAILLDGSKTPISIMLDPREGRPKSISWGGSATAPARHFNFLRTAIRDKGEPQQKEVLVFALVGLKLDAVIPGLKIRDNHQVTVAQQGEAMVDEFLYPEKYIEMGQSKAA